MGKKRHFQCYVVIRGRRPGIMRDWPACERSVSRFPNALFHGCASYGQAVSELRHYGVTDYVDELRRQQPIDANATVASTVTLQCTSAAPPPPPPPSSSAAAAPPPPPAMVPRALALPSPPAQHTQRLRAVTRSSSAPARSAPPLPPSAPLPLPLSSPPPPPAAAVAAPIAPTAALGPAATTWTARQQRKRLSARQRKRIVKRMRTHDAAGDDTECDGDATPPDDADSGDDTEIDPN